MIIKSMMDTNGQIINSGSPIQNPPIAYDQQAQVLQEQFAQYGQSMPYNQQAQLVQEQLAQYGQSMPYDQQAQLVQEQLAQYGQSMPYDQQSQLVQEQLAQYGQSMPYDQQAQLVQEQFAQYGQSMPYDQQSQVALNQPVAYDQQGQVVQNQLVAYSQQVQVALNQPIIVSNIQGQQNNQSTGVNIYTDITLNAKASVNLNNIYNNVASDTYQVQVFASNDDENITLSNGVNAIVYAGQGNDTLTFTGNQLDYFISVNGANEVVVQNINNNQTVLTLTDANAGDILKFADTSIELKEVNGKIDSSSFVSTIVKGLNVSSIWEGSNGFWLTRYSKDLSQPFTLNYAITNKTTSDDDFNFNSTNSNALKSKTGTITFDANQSEKYFVLPINSDETPEDHEVFSFALTSTDSKVAINNSNVDITILNDDFTTKSLDNLGNSTTAETIDAGDSSYAFTSDANSSSSNVIVNNFTNNDKLTINGVLLSNITVSSNNNDVTLTYPNHSITFTGVGTATNINSFNNLNKGYINVIPATIGFASQNTDPTQPYQVQSISKDEGNSGTTTYSYNVVRTGIADALDIDYSIYLNSYNGVNQDDFVGLTPNPYNSNYLIGKLSFAQNEMSKTLDIVVNADTTPEFDENFSINLAYDYTVNSESYWNNSSNKYAWGTIKNDDPYPIQIGFVKDANSDHQHIYQTEDQTNFVYHLTRTGSDTTTAVDLEYRIYVGSTDLTKDDFNLSASNLTIDPNDSNILLGKVSFASGETSKDITVVVNNDNIPEFDEDFGITLISPASNPTAVDQTAYYAHGTIKNDDPYPIQIGFASDSRNISQTEDNTKFTYHLTRSGSDTTTAVDLEYRIGVSSSGLTKEDFDLTASGLTFDPNNPNVLVGKVSFASGETSKDITVVVNNDNIPEYDERFDINLISSANNPTAVDQNARYAYGTIKNDDPYPIQIGFASDSRNISQTEDNTKFTYHLTRTGNDTTTAVDLEYRIYVGSTDLTKEDFDLTASGLTVDPNNPNVLVGKVSFASGEMSKDITVTVNNDNIPEYDEQFRIDLISPASNPTAVDQTANYAYGTIQNDDAYPIQIGFASDSRNISQTEDNTKFTYHLTRTGSDTTTAVDLEYRINFNYYRSANKDDFDLTASNLTIDPNYSDSLLGKVSFASGEMSKDITIIVNNDNIAELEEAFGVYLIAPANNPTAVDQTANYVQGIIANDDPYPIQIGFAKDANGYIQSVSQAENNTTFTYHLTRSGSDTTTAVDLEYRINFNYYQNGTNKDDFDLTASALMVDPNNSSYLLGKVSFASGETSKDITVVVNNDNIPEYDEGFGITLIAPASNLTAVDQTAYYAHGIIANDDPYPIQIGFASDSFDISQTEDQRNFVYHLTRTGSDTTTAVDLTYQIYLNNNQNSANKDDFDLTASGLTVAPNNAYVLVGKVSFASGETSKDITVVVNNDSIPEYDEGFGITLIAPASNPTVVDQYANWANGTIKNDDPYPIQIGFAKDANGNRQFLTQTEDQTNFVYHLTRSGTDFSSIDLTYQVVFLWSTNKDDFDLIASGLTVDPNNSSYLLGKVSFASGETSKDITVTVNNDAVAEFDERFDINLISSANNPTAVDQNANYASGIIKNDDPFLTDTKEQVINSSGITTDAESFSYHFKIDLNPIASNGNEVVKYSIMGFGPDDQITFDTPTNDGTGVRILIDNNLTPVLIANVSNQFAVEITLVGIHAPDAFTLDALETVFGSTSAINFI